MLPLYGVHVANHQVQHLRELGVTQAWLSSSARKIKSREGKWRGAAPQWQRRLYQVVWVVQLDQHAICVVSCQLGANGCQSGCLAGRSIQGSLLIPSMGSLLQSLPRNSPEYILGTNLGKRLLVPVANVRREARKHKRDFAPTAFLRVTPTGTIMPGNRIPDLPSTSVFPFFDCFAVLH